MAAPTGGGERNAAAPSVKEADEPDADLPNLSRAVRRERLSAVARMLDHQSALLRARQALPQTEHERKEISIEMTKLSAAVSQAEHQLQELDREHTVRIANAGDDFRAMDIDERRLLLAQRIREFVRSRRGGEDDAAADAPAG